MSEWIDIGRLEAIRRRGARCVIVPEGRVAVFRTDEDQVFALENRCAAGRPWVSSHRGGPLSEGIVHGGAVTCPLHNWVYDLATGKAMGADEGEVRTYPVRVIDGRVLIALDVVAVAAE